MVRRFRAQAQRLSSVVALCLEGESCLLKDVEVPLSDGLRLMLHPQVSHVRQSGGPRPELPAC